MNYLFRLFLLLYLSVGGLLHADAYAHAAVKHSAKGKFVGLDFDQNNNLIGLKSSVSLKARIRGVLIDTDEEEDENKPAAQGKFFQCNNYPFPFFYAHPPIYSFRSNRERIVFHEHYGYTSSPRYIRFRVFRI